MEVVIVVVAFIAFVGFRQWLNHQRRVIIHRERLVAIEKGVELPPLELEVRRSNWNVQMILLLAGLIWISLGVGIITVLSALLAHANGLPPLRQGIQWIGIAPVMIGISHLIVYFANKKKQT